MTTWLTRFSGIILTGGASRRMGRPKAFLEVGPDRRPLVGRVHQALEDAGAPEIICIGGDLERLRALGFDARPDAFPGEGPLGGLVTGLDHAGWPIAVVVSCDLPAIDGPTIRALVTALDGEPDADAAVPVVEGHQQVLAAAYRTAAAPDWRADFEAGERSVRRALTGRRVIEVSHLDPAAFVDLDVPADVDHYARWTGSAHPDDATAREDPARHPQDDHPTPTNDR